MDTLPSELVSQVFLWAISRPTYRQHFVDQTTNIPQANLSLVCRYWEQAVVATPRLWSYIHITPETTYETIERRLLLAKNEPLDVRIDVGDDAIACNDEDLRDIYHLVVGSVARWRSFVFQGTLPFNTSPRKWIPRVLPNVVEAAYYALVENDNEGLDIFNADLNEYVEYRFKPWTAAPRLERFHVETSGQFWFTECGTVTHWSIADIGEWWGGNPDRRSWHDKWETYFVRLAEICPRLEVLEILDMPDEPGMEWSGGGTDWPEFPHLHTLKLDALIAPAMIPIFTKLRIPNARNIHIANVHKCLPLKLNPVTVDTNPKVCHTLGVNPQMCHMHFKESPLHAVKILLESICRKEELCVSIDLVDAFGIKDDFVDERGDNPVMEVLRITEDYNWIKKNTRCVTWGIQDETKALLLEGSDSELTAEAVAGFCVMWKVANLRRLY